MSGHIYLLQEREFIKTNTPVYKIGKTKQSIRRFKGYPKGSELILMTKVDNINNVESNLIKKFKKLFKQRLDIGTEYFEGDVKLMVNNINSYIHTDTRYESDEDYGDGIKVVLDSSKRKKIPGFSDNIYSFGFKSGKYCIKENSTAKPYRFKYDGAFGTSSPHITAKVAIDGKDMFTFSFIEGEYDDFKVKCKEKRLYCETTRHISGGFIPRGYLKGRNGYTEISSNLGKSPLDHISISFHTSHKTHIPFNGHFILEILMDNII